VVVLAQLRQQFIGHQRSAEAGSNHDNFRHVLLRFSALLCDGCANLPWLVLLRPLTLYSYCRIYASMKIDVATMESAADRASGLLKSLSNRHRLLIICQLIDGERSVGDLAEFLKLRDSTVSQHLALLRKDGLVSARRDAQTIYYSIASDPARELLKTLYQVYCAPPKVLKGKRKL
jgi:DNA-binding transcriptional ArsR family regulator